MKLTKEVNTLCNENTEEKKTLKDEKTSHVHEHW